MTLDELNRLKAIATGSSDVEYDLTFWSNNKNVVALIAEVERLHRLAAAGDILAHQLTFKYQGEILEAWWRARGGHDKCTVCNCVDFSPPSEDEWSRALAAGRQSMLP